jgi:hypothetical protein
MTAHLNLPYNWTDCADPETCNKQIHLPDTAETLNNYPIEWVQGLLHNCAIIIKTHHANATIITVETIELYDNNRKLHSSNSNTPAVTHYHHKTKTSYTAWYSHGKRHRTNGPAETWTDGTLTQWWINGERHREDGPAVVYGNGTEEWWHNGKLHRENAPAVTSPDGTVYWYTNGKQQEVTYNHP